MHRMKQRGGKILSVIIFLAVAAILLITAGCKGKPVATATPTYRIGLGPWVGFGPLYLAQEKSFFDEAGIKVELIVLTGLAERNSALKSGRIDALAAPVDYFVLSAGNNLETSIVMAIDESNGGDGIVASKKIQRIEDLRGKTVAVQRGLPSEFFLRALLMQKNVPYNSVNTVDMETAQGGAAFISKQVDAAVVWEPWLTKATQEGNGHVLASTREYPDLIVDVLAFNKTVLGRSPQDVQKIVNVLLKAMDYWKEHPEEANRIMAPHFQVDPGKYAAILTGLKFCDLARNHAYFGTTAAPGPVFDVARRASTIWQEAKVIEKPVKAETIIDPEFVTAGK
jgi:NitT/TauT family transport system substrate-binding protein